MKFKKCNELEDLFATLVENVKIQLDIPVPCDPFQSLCSPQAVSHPGPRFKIRPQNSLFPSWYRPRTRFFSTFPGPWPQPQISQR